MNPNGNNSIVRTPESDPREGNPDDSDQNATQQMVGDLMSSLASSPYTSPNILSHSDPITNALISNLRMIGQDQRQPAYPLFSTLNHSNLAHPYYNGSRNYYPQWQMNPNVIGVNLGQSLPQYNFSFPPYTPRMNLMMAQWPSTSHSSNLYNDQRLLRNSSQDIISSLISSIANPSGLQDFHHEQRRNPLLSSPTAMINLASCQNDRSPPGNSYSGNAPQESASDAVNEINASHVRTSEKKSRKKRKRKDKDAPKRPMSAYNLFFRDKRAEILDSSIPNPSNEIVESSISEKPSLCDASMSATTSSAIIAPSDVNRSKFRRRKGRSSPHNKISFQSLGMKIGEMWRNITEDEKQSYQAMADEEKKAYEYKLQAFQKGKK